MKFGKSLTSQIDEALPEWQDKFLSYKHLKKRLKLLADNDVDADRPVKKARVDGAGDGDEVEGFLTLLEDELEKFNGFFMEKEEDYIIRHKELQNWVEEAKESEEELMKVRKEIVDFHGEMVLLENYSALNYTGLVKILKKYDKRTGALTRLPFVQKVLQEPFFTTDLLYKLVKQCEAMLDHLFPRNELSVSSGKNDADHTVMEPKPSTSSSSLISEVNQDLEEIEYMESLYMKSTLAALRALKEIRSKSSTISAFSLPPVQTTALDERWENIPVVEQIAK